MLIKHLSLGQMDNNCYVLSGPPVANSAGCLLVDLGDAPGPLLDFLAAQNLQPQAVVFTHGHYDHIAGLKKLTRVFPEMQVIIGRDAEKVVRNPLKNFSAFFALPFSVKKVDRLIAEPESLEICRLSLKVLDLPGHSPGSVGLYDSQDSSLYCGDVLFAGGIGRTDFPGASQEQLLDSIRRKILTLPDDTRLYPGHGPPSTVGAERRNNPFLQG